MIYFLDSSVLAKRYVDEAGSRRVQALFRRVVDIAVSRITLVEVASALARAARRGSLDEHHLNVAFDQLEIDFKAFRVVEVRRQVVERATELVARWPLRAYDAVQLASAHRIVEEGGAVDFWCSDRALAVAAAGGGVRATLV